MDAHSLFLECNALRAGWGNCVVSAIDNLQLTGGRCIVLAGPNGAGKSTIVKTLARQIKPVSGSVTLGGRDLGQWPAREFARKVAYVPQTVEIYRQLTVEEWVALGRNPHQNWWSWQASGDDQAAVAVALARTGLTELSNKFIDGLSGGELQRATIAMALAQQPEFLLLDEPSAHLDFRHQLELVELLLDLRRSGMGLLIVLHDLNLIARVATEVVLLKRDANGVGQVAYKGSPEEVLQPAILRTVYEVEVSILPDPDTGLIGYLPVRVWQSQEV